MRSRPALSLLVASSLLLSVAAPRAALAQPPRAPVQPVPYGQSQPVPYASGSPATSAPPPVLGAAPVTSSAHLGSDVVQLKGGGMIRGTLLEEIPNDHATVQLASGQLAIIPWERVERIDRGSAKPDPAPAVASEPEGVRVEIESDQPVSLETRGSGNSWQSACQSPCGRELAADAEYRIVGAGIRNSPAFHLAGRPGEHVVITVNTASKSAFVWGIVLTATGPVVALIGALVIAAANLESYTYDSLGNSTVNRSDNSSAKTTGTVMVVGGLAMMVGGIIMIAGNARSKVTQESAAAARAPRDEAWLRLPTWREDPTAAALPRQVSMPLFNKTF